MFRTKPLCSPDGGEGGSAAPLNEPAKTSAPAPPPAGKIVVEATRTEREANLEAELADERASHARTADEKKAREIRVAELEDELHRLRQPERKPAKKNGGSWWFNPEDE